MKRIPIRLIVASLTFALGVGAAAVWFFLRGPAAPKELPSIVRYPTGGAPVGWKRIYFFYIDKHTDLSGLLALRHTALSEGDVEVRVWLGFGLSPLEGVVLRRSAGQWSALHLEGDHHSAPKRVKRRSLLRPKSGWDSAWGNLVGSGLRALPDSSEIDYDVGGPDGWTYVVEVREGSSYRVYHYESPEFSRRKEAEQMLEISNIIAREFSLPSFAAEKVSDR